MRDMATSEDSFLADLNELLSEDETELKENDSQKKEEEEEEEEIIISNLNYDDLDSVPKLQKTQRFSDIMEKVEKALDFVSEYKLIVDCNKLLVKLNKEIIILHNFIRHNYIFKSPNLEWLVTHAITYTRVVKKIVDETELTPDDLEDLVQSAVVTDGSSTARGKPLPQDVPEKTKEACNRVLDLYSSRKKVLEFIEIKTRIIAPNLSAIVGSKVATKLILSAGGLSALAKMPPTCNVQLVGHKRKKSFVGSLVDILNETEIVLNTRFQYQNDACELLAAKLTVAARVDSIRGDSSGAIGIALRDEILAEIDKLQKPKRLIPDNGTRTKSSSKFARDKLFKF